MFLYLLVVVLDVLVMIFLKPPFCDPVAGVAGGPVGGVAGGPGVGGPVAGGPVAGGVAGGPVAESFFFSCSDPPGGAPEP